MRWTKHRSPVRTLDVADVGDWRGAELWWTGKPPTHLCPFELAALAELDDGAVALREDFEKRVAEPGRDASFGPFLEAVEILFEAGLADVGGVAIAHTGLLDRLVRSELTDVVHQRVHLSHRRPGLLGFARPNARLETISPLILTACKPTFIPHGVAHTERLGWDKKIGRLNRRQSGSVKYRARVASSSFAKIVHAPPQQDVMPC